MKKLGHVEPRNHMSSQGKILQVKTDRLVMNKKKNRFGTTTSISKRANANLDINISQLTIYRRLNEINLNSQVASTKPCISKRNKMKGLKFTTKHVSYGMKNTGILFILAMFSYNLFNYDGKRFVQRGPR